jgi:hypothetical protein
LRRCRQAICQRIPALLSPDFATTGFQAQNVGSEEIRRFQVLGERSSGTNFVKRLLGRNTALTPTESLGWKHGFAQMMAIPPDLAVICVVRSAEDWVLSMHAKPWHTTPALQRLAFSDFIRAPWDTIVDRPRYFEGAQEQGLVGQPLQADRHPVTGAPFDSLFALRRAKLQGLLGHLARGGTCVLLRAETAQVAPEQTLGQIAKALSLPARTGAFRPVVKRLGSKFKASVPDRPGTPQVMLAQDREYMISQLDMTLEAQLGYTY